MRRPLYTAAVLLVPLASLGAEPPIPQNPERQEQQFRALVEWNRRSLGEAYEKVGRKDPRWDEPARAALEAAARFFGHAVDPCTPEEEVYALAQKALDAGCDDPMIRYLHARASHVPNYPGPAEYARRMIAAGDALGRSEYPPFRRAIALYKAGQLKSQMALIGAARKDAARLLDAALALVPKYAPQDEKDPETAKKWLEVAIQVVHGHHALKKDFKEAFEHVDSVLAEAPDLKVMRLLVKGDYLTNAAWEARGNGLADTVTEEGWKAFNERLVEAETTLEQAWELKPSGVRAPNLMLAVATGLNKDRDVMETWFRRAMEADGNNLEACQAKLNWLDPKWHGTVDELVAFGRACRETKNWRAGITLLAAEAHYRVVQTTLKKDEYVKYLNEADVWDDIRSVNEEFLAHYPTDHSARNLYAGFATLGGHFDEANEQFDAIGEKLVASPFFSLQAMKGLRNVAAPPAGAVPKP